MSPNLNEILRVFGGHLRGHLRGHLKGHLGCIWVAFVIRRGFNRNDLKGGLRCILGGHLEGILGELSKFIKPVLSTGPIV